MADETYTRSKKILAKVAGYTREVESDTELAKLALSGELMPYDPVWHPRMARWAHASELEELHPFFVKAREELEKRLAEEAERRANRGFFGRLLDRILRR